MHLNSFHIINAPTAADALDNSSFYGPRGRRAPRLSSVGGAKFDGAYEIGLLTFDAASPPFDFKRAKLLRLERLNWANYGRPGMPAIGHNNKVFRGEDGTTLFNRLGKAQAAKPPSLPIPVVAPIGKWRLLRLSCCCRLTNPHRVG